ncbi:MAG: arylsulfatase [Opitutae bacterium]|nr:arylsulfatase [Opitutae bacterium]
MKIHTLFRPKLLILVACSLAVVSSLWATKPNIILILADDLGWGDVSCYQPGNRFQTPEIDRIAREGLRMTNAHAPHSVCSPTRYAVLTGRYCWRTFLREGVLPGYAKPLIAKRRMTLASLLKQRGYATGAFGKWHIGMGWIPVKGDPGDFHYGSQIHASGSALAAISRRVNHAAPISGGPTDLGFDTFFGTPSNRGRIPVFIRDNRVVGSPLRNKSGLMKDPTMRADTVDDLYAEEAVRFIEKAAKQKMPFFVYLPLNAIHGAVTTPREFRGKSGVSDRTDKCLWLDRSVGRVLNVLDRTRQAGNTLLIFTSDNGPFAAKGSDLKKGHDASGPYRGFKTDVWDGGTRVPFLVRLPGRIEAGRVSDHLLCLTDVMATLAGLMEQPLAKWAGEDSFDQSSVWFDEEAAAARNTMITQSYTGILSIRRGKWKLILDTKGSGGFFNYSPEVLRHETMAPWRTDMSQTGQLYDLELDPYETTDLFEKHPDVVNELKLLMRSQITQGRSRPL